jgi:predicted nucleic acid-binding protein
MLLDADVLIGALDGSDPHHHRARDLFTKWRDDHDACAISIVNLTEALIAPSAYVSKLAAAREAIAALGVTVHQPSEAIGVEAARLRQRHQISLPDAYCLATAKHTSSAISSFDQKILKAAEREGIRVEVTGSTVSAASILAARDADRR